jgi:signal recognition particle subunit SRP54
MGPLSKVFGMLPGMGEIKDRIAGIDERKLIGSRRSSIR